MVARVKKRIGYSSREVFDLFDDDIDEILAGLAEEKLTPQEVVELSELVATLNTVHEAGGRELRSLPSTVHRQLNECAKRGMRRGQGRKKGQPDSFLIKLFKEDVIEQASLRKHDLKKSGDVRGSTEAEYQAAEEASATLRERGIRRGSGVGTIIKKLYKI